MGCASVDELAAIIAAPRIHVAFQTEDRQRGQASLVMPFLICGLKIALGRLSGSS